MKKTTLLAILAVLMIGILIAAAACTSAGTSSSPAPTTSAVATTSAPASSTAATSSIPATTSISTNPRAPLIPHITTGARVDCLSCHATGTNGARKIPSSHSGYNNSICLNCHNTAG